MHVPNTLFHQISMGGSKKNSFFDFDPLSTCQSPLSLPLCDSVIEDIHGCWSLLLVCLPPFNSDSVFFFYFSFFIFFKFSGYFVLSEKGSPSSHIWNEFAVVAERKCTAIWIVSEGGEAILEIPMRLCETCQQSWEMDHSEVSDWVQIGLVQLKTDW